MGSRAFEMGGEICVCVRLGSEGRDVVRHGDLFCIARLHSTTVVLGCAGDRVWDLEFSKLQPWSFVCSVLLGASWTLTQAISWAVRGMWDKQTTRIDTPTVKQAKARLRETGLTKTDQGTWTVSKKGIWTVGAGGVRGSTSDRW